MSDMMPAPIALGLTLCDYVLVEEGSKKVSLIGSFIGIRAAKFPFVPLPFCVFAPLTGGLGDGRVELSVTDLDSNEEIYSLVRALRFPDRFVEVHVLFRLSECEFPQAGSYLVTLLIDGDWIAHRRLRVYSMEAP
jgi:hypothetical protein